MERVNFDLEEYRALRAEIIQSMDDGNQIMSFGLAAVGLSLGAGLTSKDPTPAFIVLGFFLPVLAALVLSLWFAAQERVARASHYLTGVEARIKAACGNDQGESWEAWLRGRPLDSVDGRRGTHFWYTEQTGIGLFGVIISSSFITALSLPPGGVASTMRVSALTLSAMICCALFINILYRFANWRRWLTTTYEPSGGSVS